MGKNLLYWQWHSFLKSGVEDYLAAFGFTVRTFFYQLTDWENDEDFLRKFSEELKKVPTDAVFSINFNPMISNLCEKEGIPYLSWVYDSPLHIRNLEPLKNSVNRIFFFDRGEAEAYRESGYPAEYLPLAGDIRTFSKTIDLASAAERAKYQSEIAFVGKLYRSDYDYYMSPLTEYQRGFLEGIVNSQGKVYGGYLIPPLLTDELLSDLNQSYAKASNGTASIAKRELEYLLAQEVTARERFLILSLLAKRHPVEVYSTERDDRLPMRAEGDRVGIRFHDYIDYYAAMPLAFAGAKINLNISLKCIQTGIPLRVFDVLSCGGFLITNFQAELPEYFALGEELVCYGSVEELPELVDFYLRNDDARRRIAANGRARVAADYTVEKQLRKIFEK